MPRTVLKNVKVFLRWCDTNGDPTGNSKPVLGVNAVTINRTFEDNSGHTFESEGMEHDAGNENSDVSLSWLSNDYSASAGTEADFGAYAGCKAELVVIQGTGTGIRGTVNLSPTTPTNRFRADTELVIGGTSTNAILGTAPTGTVNGTVLSAFNAKTLYVMDIEALQWQPVSGSPGGYSSVSVGWPVNGTVGMLLT